MSKQDFIQQILPHALEVQAKYGVPASLVIAQAALESGWGESAKGNNYFGIKATKNNPSVSVTTHEYENGQRIQTIASFTAYTGLAASVEGYGKLLGTKERYKDVIGANGYEAADAVQRAGYATDPNYSRLLKTIIKENNLTQYDDKKREYNGKSYEEYEKKLSNDDPLTEFLNVLFDAIASLFNGGKKLQVTSVDQNTAVAMNNLPVKKTVKQIG